MSCTIWIRTKRQKYLFGFEFDLSNKHGCVPVRITIVPTSIKKNVYSDQEVQFIFNVCAKSSNEVTFFTCNIIFFPCNAKETIFIFLILSYGTDKLL